MRCEQLKDKVAVVTGGSRGIGLHIAKALHEEGMKVVITGRSPSIIDAAKSVGEHCMPLICDQRKPMSVASMGEFIADEFGHVDLLVANAGAMGTCPVEEMDLEFWNNIIETNLTGTFLVCQSLLRLLRRPDHSDIMIISSMSGKGGDPNATAYAASKFGLQGFAQALVQEVRRDNIRVMVLNPSAVNTKEDTGPLHGSGLHLHAADLAATVVHLAKLPGRTMIRDMDIWGTNPF